MALAPSDHEWHEIVKASDVPESGLDVSIEANAAECAATAKRLGVLEIAALSLQASVKPWRKGGLRVDGRVRGRITQACVITLDPVEELVDETFKALFSAESEAARTAVEAEIVVDALEDDDPPETLTRGEIDLCEIAIEHLALGINPYPRKDGAALEDEMPPGAAEVAETVEKPGAFEALSAMKPGADKS